jgi:branched-chain amino acid transport system ATP-binding protein
VSAGPDIGPGTSSPGTGTGTGVAASANGARDGIPLLELRDVDAGYGPFRSLFGVSFAIQPHSVMALLGSNGSGKTTVVRVCSGLIRPTSGSLWFEGEEVTGRRAFRLARLGIIHAPEGRSVFASLSVEENLALTFRQVFGRRGTHEALVKAYHLFPRLGERRRQMAGTLSGGEQRMLSLARVLVRAPKLLITDELSLGLAPVIIDEVYETLTSIRDSGTALLIVEQHVRQALSLADDVVVLAKGSVTLSGRVDELGDITERLLPAATDAPGTNGHSGTRRP